MDIDTYLNRIDVTAHRPPSLAYLAELQRQHLLTVPFENLSVIRQEPIVLDERLLYAKVVARARGGFCYELNGAFGWLLCELGFDVIRVAAGVYHAGRQEFGPTFDHMALLVRIDGLRYLVDVGFGDSARAPIPLPDGVALDISGHYRLHPGEGAFLLQKEDDDGMWQSQYRFTDQPRAMADYVDRCAETATSPESSFTQRIICTIATSDGRISLSGDSLTVTCEGRKEKTRIEDEAALAESIRMYFGKNFV